MLMKKFMKFNDVADRTLRAWNRFSVFFNVLDTVGSKQALEYMSSFPNEDKADLRKMLADLKKMGYEPMKAAISRGAYSV